MGFFKRRRHATAAPVAGPAETIGVEPDHHPTRVDRSLHGTTRDHLTGHLDVLRYVLTSDPFDEQVIRTYVTMARRVGSCDDELADEIQRTPPRDWPMLRTTLAEVHLDALRMGMELLRALPDPEPEDAETLGAIEAALAEARERTEAPPPSPRASQGEAADETGGHRDRPSGRPPEPGIAEVGGGPAPERVAESDAGLTRLQAQLRAADPGDREEAAREIGRLGPAASAAVPALIEALTDDHMGARRAVAEALGNVGDSRAVEPLSAALNDLTDYRVIKEPHQVPSQPVDARVEAALALGSIGGDSAAQALRSAPGGDVRGAYKGLSVDEALDEALAQLGVAGRERTEVLAEQGADTAKASGEMVEAADEHRRNGRLTEALECASRATELDSTNGWAWMETGLIEVDRGQVLSATAAFMRAVSADPGLKGSEPGARLAVVYDRLGMTPELGDVRSKLASAGLELDPGAEREWEHLVADTDPAALRASLTAG